MTYNHVFFAFFINVIIIVNAINANATVAINKQKNERIVKMRRVFLVDYKQNGIDMHQVIEIHTAVNIESITLTALLRWKIGMQCEISCIVELFTDMTCDEIEKISQSPESGCIDRNLIYVNPTIALV